MFCVLLIQFDVVIIIWLLSKSIQLFFFFFIILLKSIIVLYSILRKSLNWIFSVCRNENQQISGISLFCTILDSRFSTLFNIFSHCSYPFPLFFSLFCVFSSTLCVFSCFMASWLLSSCHDILYLWIALWQQHVHLWICLHLAVCFCSIRKFFWHV